MRATIQVGMAVWLSGCTFVDLDYSGKACPCPEGWGCRAQDQVCVQLQGTGDCAIQAHDFHVAWATPNTIRWAWEPIGDAADFAGYRVRVGMGADPTSGGEVTEFTSTENPELGFFQIPHIGSVELVTATTTQVHEPATLYWSQLVAIDNRGCSWSSEVLTRTTGAPPAYELELFDEALPGTSELSPKNVAVVQAGDSHTGINHIHFPFPGESDGENIQLYGMHFPLNDLGSNLQSFAYVEFYLWLNHHEFWSRVLLAAAPPATPEAETRHFRRETLAMKGDEQYHLVQVPISALTPDEGVPMASTDELRKFMFGCSPFNEGTIVRIDSIFLRW